MKYSTAIMAHESREEYLPYLYKMLGAEVPTFIDKGRPGDKENLGVWGNCRRCWLAYDKKKPWHLVLQDDAILTHRFHEKLELLLEEVDDGAQVVSLYVGGSPTELVRSAKMQRAQGMLLPYINNEIALLFRTELIEDMVAYCDERDAQDDKLMTKFVQSRWLEVYHPLPSLVDHREAPSLYREFYPDPSRPVDVRRKAAWFEPGREATTVIIIAAGDATRWGGYLGVPKHLVPVPYTLETGGVVEVPLLRRTVHQLHRRDLTPIVVAKRGTKGYRLTHARTEYVTTEQDKHDGADKFLSSAHLWDKEGRTVILWGDVFFTEKAMDKIFTQPVAGDVPTKDWHLYCRPGPSSWTGTRYGENFALSFYPEHHDLMREHLDKIVDAKMSGKARRCGGWELYRSLIGVGLNDHIVLGNYTEINDWTEDFDTPEDYEQWCKNRVRFKREVKRYP